MLLDEVAEFRGYGPVHHTVVEADRDPHYLPDFYLVVHDPCHVLYPVDAHYGDFRGIDYRSGEHAAYAPDIRYSESAAADILETGFAHPRICGEPLDLRGDLGDR